MPPANSSILALDVGAKRVGVAIASTAARLPRPLTTLGVDDNFSDSLRKIIETENVLSLVVGFPRDMSGQATGQTKAVEDFVAQLKQEYDLPIHFQDESVTSKQAEAELQARRKTYAKGDIDALAATYILQDFLAEHKELAG